MMYSSTNSSSTVPFAQLPSQAMTSLTVASLPPRLQDLVSRLRQTASMTPELAGQLVRSANIQIDDLWSWVDVMHPVADSYGRQLVYAEKNFEIMVMSWAPGDFSAIHDHGYAQWGAVQSFGAAEHSVYQFKHNTLTTLAIHPFQYRTVIAVNHDLIHQMGNPSQTPMLSLHVYGTYQPQESITGGARVFNLYNQTIQHTDGGVFFCLPEAEIVKRTPHLKGDRLTTLRHHRQMLDRVNRILQVELSPQWMEKAMSIQMAIASLAGGTHEIPLDL